MSYTYWAIFFDNAIDSILQKKQPGRIELKLNYECEGNVFILKVKDNGMGIDYEMQKKNIRAWLLNQR